MYRYETHLHTAPVSGCANKTVKECIDFYKSIGYDGIFITNHFLDGNIRMPYEKSYEEKIKFFFSEQHEAQKYGKEIGLKVFYGAELSYKGTDFLVYGLDENWYLEHPEIMEMKKSEELPYLAENGALIIQAHPFREAGYIDHIRLFPRCVAGLEIINANRTDFENTMAELFATEYGLIKFAGSDNHIGENQKKLAGVEFKTPINSIPEFIERIRKSDFNIFTLENG